MSDGRAELARRLRRVFISDAGTGNAPPDETLLRFAADILAADYTDPAWGERPGDGGPAMQLTALPGLPSSFPVGSVSGSPHGAHAYNGREEEAP